MVLPYARDSRDWIFETAAGFERDSAGQNVLVGGREIGPVSQAGEVVQKMLGMAG
jgi:hypothetical protein